MFFETIKSCNMKIYNLWYHSQRIYDTIGKFLDLDILNPQQDLTRIKVIYDYDDIIDILYFKYNKGPIYSFKFIHSDIEYDYKYLNRDKLELLSSAKENCDDIIILKNNIITDTSIANIAIYENNRWLTPTKPLLFGTTRARYIKNKKLYEDDCITIERVQNAQKIALLNSMIDFDILPYCKFSF